MPHRCWERQASGAELLASSRMTLDETRWNGGRVALIEKLLLLRISAIRIWGPRLHHRPLLSASIHIRLQ
jgi:hypothetical protein